MLNALSLCSHPGQEQGIEIDVDLANGIVGRVGVVVHDPDVQGLVLEVGVVGHLEAKPLGVPDRVQGLPTHLRLVRRFAELDLHEGVGVLRAPVHDGQVPSGQDPHLQLARHLGQSQHSNFFCPIQSLSCSFIHFTITTSLLSLLPSQYVVNKS